MIRLQRRPALVITHTPNHVACMLALMLLLLSLACQPASTPTTSTASKASSKEWDAYVNQFIDAYFVAHPDVAVVAGRHEFDGKLPDWSAEGIRKEIQRLHSERDRGAGFKDESLDER